MSGDNQDNQDLANHFNWTRAATCSPNQYFRKPHELPSFTNNEDPDEMQHYSAFHQSTLFVKVIQKDIHTKIQYLFKNYNMTLLDMYNGLFQVYCIKQEGRIH